MGLSHSSYNFLLKSFTCLDASCISVPSTNREETSLKEQPDSAVVKRDSTQVFSCDGSEDRKVKSTMLCVEKSAQSTQIFLLCNQPPEEIMGFQLAATLVYLNVFDTMISL